MDTLDTLDEILSIGEAQYHEQDLFLTATELIGSLSDHDIPQVLSLWQSRPRSWHDRFCHDSSDIQKNVLVALLEIALVPPIESANVLCLMARLPKEADDSALSRSLVDFTKELWLAEPNLRRQIQMCSWNCGLSGRLRRELGLNTWQEAKF
jgi:hypothetical protein